MKKAKLLAIFLTLIMIMSLFIGCGERGGDVDAEGPIVIKIGHTDSSQR
jgi:hypothetical protein